MIVAAIRVLDPDDQSEDQTSLTNQSVGAASSTVTGDTASVASVESGVPYHILDQSQEEAMATTPIAGDDTSDRDLTLRGQLWPYTLCLHCQCFLQISCFGFHKCHFL